ncbi:aerobic-type carbon monoxide dehydrogenase, middle subunit CoxM/CutM-like protein [Halobacteroides halobius DSM 5150]|uniref:Aerobic-type carbon monoxide dehydrogenase, middle subunit CoxM/CutM-like protein n=1 Tax=Halobacteroides halobius (strain ATCC 35273 / DSM 5150 / MD-1) TaxID=748449 RepID=L0K9H2_HALHC|nr:xanthine dehydrogenase family protein subunit M [Halobacteroides halobius]AGB41009.1 aerobic-type carbon monoxide dehydrogenase, middle subunit CoxM/CutM-like protein [Halobacteroides halobius DSM 5150]
MSRYVEKAKSKQKISGEDFKGYFAPEGIEGAINLLEEYGDQVVIVAGGTDLLVDYNERLYDLDGILDLKNIEKLSKINVKEDHIEIGAMVTHTEIEKSASLKEYLPILSQAAADVGSPQIRNRGTIGGNVVTASPAGDLLPALLAYKAEFELVSIKGKERVLAKDFFTGPKKAVITPEQLLTKIIIPKPKETTFSVWKKVGKRKALAISSITLALVIEFNQDNLISDARACMGAVAPTPIEIKEFKSKLQDKSIEQIDYQKLGQIIADNISPIDDIRGTEEYRRDTGRDIMISALKELNSNWR